MKKNQTILIVFIKNVVVVVGSFLGGFYFTSLFHEPTSLVGGLWATISAIIVLEASHPETFASAKNRIIGTFIGAVLSGIYLLIFPFTVIGFAATIGVGVVVCHLFSVPQSIKLTGITIAVIMIVSTITQELHPVKNAGLRFAESAIGAGMALLIAYVIFHIERIFSRKKV